MFASGVPLIVLPLDVTHKALTTRPRIEAFRSLGRVGEAVAAWTDFFERFDVAKYGSQGAPLHDPTVIAWLLRPELFSGRKINVEIEVTSELARGMTVADWWGVTDREPNALFIGDLDADGFLCIAGRAACEPLVGALSRSFQGRDHSPHRMNLLLAQLRLLKDHAQVLHQPSPLVLSGKK